MGDPFALGAIQSMIIFEAITEVVGAAGWSGLKAALSSIVVEY